MGNGGVREERYVNIQQLFFFCFLTLKRSVGVSSFNESAESYKPNKLSFLQERSPLLTDDHYLCSFQDWFLWA